MGASDTQGRVIWFSGDATLASVSCINWAPREFTFCRVSALLVPFGPMRQQGIIIADVELLSLSISAVVLGGMGDGVIHIEVSDNTDARFRMSKKRPMRGVAVELQPAFPVCVIRTWRK